MPIRTHNAKPISAEQIAGFFAVIEAIDTFCADLVSMPNKDRRRLPKMGSSSDNFCRALLALMDENRALLPANIDIDRALADLKSTDALRPCLLRMNQASRLLLDTDLALRNNIMDTALRGYRILKHSGDPGVLLRLKKEVGDRFERKSSKTAKTKRRASPTRRKTATSPTAADGA